MHSVELPTQSRAQVSIFSSSSHIGCLSCCRITEPEERELASRDVVSRRMEEHIAKGKGVKTPFGDHL